MSNYVFLFHIPGAAGNFFSRCLALSSDQAYGWIPKNSNSPYISIDEKYRTYSYESSSKCKDWIAFEQLTVPYNSIFAHHEIPDGSISIWSSHPRYSLLNNNLIGNDDLQHVFYINPVGWFEWTILNSLYKNSFIDVKWLRDGHAMSQDPNVHQVSLANIINSPETLWEEIQKVYAIINHKCNNKELVQQLWQQWIKTTLKKDQFDSFKRSIGFNL
jgi:hypothetical protein